MLPVLSSRESRAFDTYLIKNAGISPLVLMENAARGAVNSIEDWTDELSGTAALVFCGKGNNGGDGYAIARILHEQGVQVHVFSLGKPNELSKDAAAQHKILSAVLQKDNLHPYPLRDSHFLSHIGVGIIIDAMIGTGATGELKGKYKEAVLDINAFKEHFGAKVLAVDVPTGLDSDTGATETMEGLEPVVVHADRTATMAALKQGFFLQSAPDIVGEVAVVDLGAPLSSWSSYEEIKTFLIDEEDASTAFAPRKIATSKFDYGHALIISGSKGLTGAAVMSAMAALRMGCGLVSVATPESQRAIVAQSMPEIMTFGIHEDSHGLPTSDAFAQLEDLISKSTVVQYGSGILFTDETKELAIELLKNVDQTLVLDAGALIGLAKHHDLFKKRKAPTVITPHNGEMAQLLGVKREKVEQDRIGVARDFATKNNTIVVLKGAPTLFAFPDGSVFINATGNPGMATAGAGDVLCGMITGTIAQKPEDVLESVMFAVYAHGLAGDLARKEMTEQALIATDIVRFIPAAFKKLGLE